MNRHGIHRILQPRISGPSVLLMEETLFAANARGYRRNAVVCCDHSSQCSLSSPVADRSFSLPDLSASAGSLLSSPASAASSLRSLSLFSFSAKASLRLSHVGFAGLSCLLRFIVLHAVMFLCVRVFVCGIIVCERSLNLLGVLLLLDCRCGSRYDLQHFPA